MENKVINKVSENIENIQKTIKKDGKGFCKDLFKFEKYFFLNFLFYIHILSQIFVACAYLYGAFNTGNIFLFIGSIILYPVVFFVVRFYFEFLSIIFSINKNLQDIKDQK